MNKIGASLFWGLCLITAAFADDDANGAAANSSPKPSLFDACIDGDAAQVKALIAQGADVNAATDGVSPLMFAVYAGQPEIVKLLVAAKADVSYKNAEGITPLFLAAYLGNEEIMGALAADAGADDTAIAANIAKLQDHGGLAAMLSEAAVYDRLDYRKLRQDEYDKGDQFRVFFKVARIFVDKTVYRASCYMKDAKNADPNANYEFFITSKERPPFIEGDSIEAYVSYQSLENVEVSAAPYRAVEQALFQLDKIISIW